MGGQAASQILRRSARREDSRGVQRSGAVKVSTLNGANSDYPINADSEASGVWNIRACKHKKILRLDDTGISIVFLFALCQRK